MSDSQKSGRLPMSRRSALKALGAAGGASFGAGVPLGGAGTVAAQTSTTDLNAARKPVFLEQKIRQDNQSIVDTPGWFTRNEANLAYFGATWVSDNDPWYNTPNVWRHKFMIASTGWCWYKDRDGSPPNMSGNVDELRVSAEPGDGDARVHPPKYAEMIGFAQPDEFSDTLRDLVDTDELAQTLHDAGTEPIDVDVDRELAEFDDEVGFVTGVGLETDDLIDVAVFLSSLTPIGTVADALWNGIDTFRSFTGEYEEQYANNGFEYGGLKPDNKGFGSFHYVMFDVDVEPGVESSVDVSSLVHSRTGSFDTEATWSIDLEALPEPPEPTCMGETISAGDVWRRGAEPSEPADTTGYTLQYDVEEPSVQIERPYDGAVYEVDEPIQFAGGGDGVVNDWHADHQSVSTECEAIGTGEIHNGAANEFLNPGRWDLALQHRNEAGLSDFDEASIHIEEDLDSAIVPVGDAGNVQLADLELPQGTDEYREVRS